MKKSWPDIVCIFFILMVCSFCSQSNQVYKAPERQDIGDKVYEYVNSPLFEGKEAGAFDPELGSPEAAVVKFLCSKVRQDGVWKEALVPEEEWTDRLKRKLEDWDEWQVTKWKLKNIEFVNQKRIYLTVYFGIKIGGDTDEGEDEFELVLSDGVWKILYPPT